MTNKITGANAGGVHRLPIRALRAARIAQFCRSPESDSFAPESCTLHGRRLREFAALRARICAFNPTAFSIV
jgi:hypothetical protein